MGLPGDWRPANPGEAGRCAGSTIGLSGVKSTAVCRLGCFSTSKRRLELGAPYKSSHVVPERCGLLTAS
jgi:hypothetical protein